VRDRAADTLQEIEHLEIRSMFTGFGFYIDGILVAAAWEGRFQLRYHQDHHWIYEPVPDQLIDDPELLVPLVRERAAELAGDPKALPRRRQPG
jgi:TfoX/Sxy family transcriptional regulator of competence genes